MHMHWWGRTYPIGLDVGCRSIKMVQLGSRAGQVRLHARAACKIDSAALDPEGALTPAATSCIRQMLADGGFSGAQVVCAVPRQSMVIKTLRLPMIEESMHAALLAETKLAMGLEMDQCTIAYLNAGVVRQGAQLREEVILMAAQRPRIDLFLAGLEKAGVAVRSLDAKPCALYRSVERFTKPDELHVLADVGAEQTLMTIGRGTQMQFYKAIPIGAQHLNEAVSRKLSIDLDDAIKLRQRVARQGESDNSHVRQAVYDASRSTLQELAHELSLCLRYHAVTFRGKRPTKVSLLGSQSGDPMLLRAIAEALLICVEPGYPLEQVAGHDKWAQDKDACEIAQGAWGMALGLALKCVEIDEKPERACA